MDIKIALLGNPNCGKTTLFNLLTGSSQYVGNWPGVTVEKKEGRLKGHKDITIVDLPGVYSLSPYTLEEVVTRNFLIDENPDVIINIVDASNLERNLYLTTQLLEVGIPIIVSLNMMDVVAASGDKIDILQLSNSLGCRVVETSALKNKGVDILIKQTLDLIKEENVSQLKHKFNDKIEQALIFLEKKLEHKVDVKNKRWFSVKVFERDEKVIEQLGLKDTDIEEIEAIILECEDIMDDDSQSIITSERYQYIEEITKQCLTRAKRNNMNVSDKIDMVVTNRVLALPIFFVVMWGIYYIAIQSLGSFTIEFMHMFFSEIIGQPVLNLLENIGTAPWLVSLTVEGIIGGVGSVLAFVPQIMILFFFISFLEDCGYMARVAFIMDRIFRKFGLSGKSFIPMLIGTGCSVPGIMASRTIENDKDRKMTIMLTPFIPCSAKLPVFALFVGLFFPNDAWVGPSMYILGIIMVIISGIILKKTPLFKGDPAPFVMELPQYRLPSLKNVLLHMWDRAKGFIIKAGTIIFIASAVIWFLQTFNWQFNIASEGESILASIGRAVSPVFVPLGFGTWQATVASITGMFAKESIVSTLSILYGAQEAVQDSSLLFGAFTQVSAYAFMVFTLLAAPCVAAIGATKREMGSWRWTLIAIGYQTGLAYIVALIIYQVGSRLF